MTGIVATFKALHIPGDPPMLFSIWGAGSAKAVARSRAELGALGVAGISYGHGPWAAAMDWLA